MTLRWVPGWNGLTEPEAVSYVAAVEAADELELEFGVARAINDFVTGCKTDGIWDAIKACCILAGARTLGGALVPLVGAAPTNNFFVDADYDRETGLVGDASIKYLDSNRLENADLQNSHHISVFVSDIGGGTLFPRYISSGILRNELVTTQAWSRGAVVNTTSSTGFNGVSRASSAGFTSRRASSDTFTSGGTQAVVGSNYLLFRDNAGSLSSSRLAFYSIGESLDLAALNTRVSNLITAIGAAIP